MEESTNTVNLTWRPAKNGPEDIDEPVLCITEGKNIMVLKNTMGWKIGQGKPSSNFDWLRSKYGIEWWTYSKEIII